MNHKKLTLALMIASSLALGGCNGELEPGEGGTPTNPPTTPPDSGNPTTPPTTPGDEDKVGTWENKDEDGDGIPDDRDDYPFDAERSQYPSFNEAEPNDNPGVATPISLDGGVVVKGVISSELDKGDLYRFSLTEPRSLTAYLYAQSPRFLPQVYVSNEQGLVQNDIVLHKSQSPNVYVVNFQLHEAGTYHLSVIDEAFSGEPDLSYQVTMFVDADVDAFDDEKELALGSDVENQDLDADGIIDGLEFSGTLAFIGTDIDGDGQPNWRDSDADGDGFADAVEGLSDLDRDLKPNFLDLDADGNGIDDAVEGGDPADPLNTDGDRFIDHLDLDDDNDGIFDVNDLQRLVPARSVVWQAPGDLFVSELRTLFDDSSILNFIRAGDSFELWVEGYPTAPESPLLVANINGQDFNLFPTQTVREGQITRLRFTLPEVAGKGRLSVVSGTDKSEAFPIEIGDATLPLLLKSNPVELRAGQQITLSGDNFDEDTTVFFNKLASSVSLIDANTLSVTVPEGVTGGSYYVTNSFGTSNLVTFIVQQTVAVKVSSSAPRPLAAIGGIYPEFANDISGSSYDITKAGTLPEVVFTYTRNEQGELESYLSAFYRVDDTEIDFSFESTALANMVLHLSFYADARGLSTDAFVALLQTTDAYAVYVADATAQLMADSDFFAFKDRSDATVALLKRHEAAIKEELSARHPAMAKARARAPAAPQAADNTHLSHIEPSIVSYPETNGTWDAFDMSLEATTFAENSSEILNNCGAGVDPKWYEILNADGCVELQNRSQLYLSARVYPLDPATGSINMDEQALNSPLQEHITTPWDSGMLGPQTGTWLGFSLWSADSLIDKCVYKDCLYQIITPGVDGIFGPSPFTLQGAADYDKRAQDARKMLAIRTIIDNVVIRFYSILFNAAGVDLNDSKYKKEATALAIVKAVYQYLPAISTEIDKIMAKDNPTDVDWLNLAESLGKEIYSKEIKAVISDPANLASYGPITMAILTACEIDSTYFINKMIQKVAEKFIPGWGQITAAYEASQLADAMIDMASTVKDLAVVPTKLDYVVTWGLKASDITPRAIQKTNEIKRFTIVGSGMAVVKSKFGDAKPEVKVFDTGNGNKELNTEFNTVNKQGTELVFELNRIDQIQSAVGPLRVEVHHRDDVSEVPYEILIGTELTIANISPARGTAGKEVVITGIGFSKQPMGNKVTFSGGGGERLVAAVKSASTDTLVVIVPNGIVSGYVTVGVAEDLSNEYPFAGASQVLITFGDNGNINDDVFKLSVNGKVLYDNNQPKRAVGPIPVSLEDGEHTVTLTGIRADDGIATYYIEFEGDVTSVSGDALSGRDLCPDTHKNYRIQVAASGDTGASPAPQRVPKVLALQPESASASAETVTECPVKNP
ncbi:IPT/TIG domain-containing protein [Shewanella sp. FJAT-52076]|uniref:IPT/TIG domain-containing protein n=1 Tax=Shewanella sp. FJAT-52076 TaxID=2864202 RepID=UPI001C6607D2|nr:IPT/TIG domain-containing protein [Shewanella sp. FJAT-52076]QYJ76086.1 IPT/TIG domain-containing protein [Shewanella sp. FJAT-52076]